MNKATFSALSKQLVEPGEGQKFGLIAICVIVDDRRAAVPRSYEVEQVEVFFGRELIGKKRG